MRYSVAFGVTVLASIAGVAVANDIPRIKLQGLPAIGNYEDVASLDKDGNCARKTVTWSQSGSPLDEELSLIFRGPMRLKQVAVYTQQDGSKNKRSPRVGTHQRRHQRFHEHNNEVREEKAQEEKRAVGEAVVVTFPNGDVKTWANDWSGSPNPAAVPTPAADPAPAVKVKDTKDDPKPSAPAPTSAKHVDAGAGNWARVAYYNAREAKAEGLTFLGNVRFPKETTALGWVLAYLTPDGKSASTSANVLEDTLIPDNTEVVISSDKPCTGGDCGATAPYSDAHHGFAGKMKMFLAEYSMPYSDKKGPPAWGNKNPNAPSFWALNSKVVNTQQYGKCSCWHSGCGEWDIHEVTVEAANNGSTSLHMGSSYAITAPETIPRPSEDDKTMKIAAILTGDTVHVQVLDNGMSFDDVIKGSTVDALVNHNAIKSYNVNLNVVVP